MKQVPKAVGIYSLVDALSGNDITKHESIYEMNYIYCLTILWKRKIENEVMEERHKNSSGNRLKK